MLLSTRLLSRACQQQFKEGGEDYRRGLTRIVEKRAECRTDIPDPTHQSLRMIMCIPFMRDLFQSARWKSKQRHGYCTLVALFPQKTSTAGSSLATWAFVERYVLTLGEQPL